MERVNVHVWVRAEDVRAYRAAGLVPNSAVTALAQALDRVPLPDAPRREAGAQLALGGLLAPVLVLLRPRFGTVRVEGE